MADLQPMLPPWSNFPIPGFIRTEFKRRGGYGLKSPGNVNGATIYSSDYRGSQTAWIRLCSNALVTYKPNNKITNGFVFSRGNVGFYNSHGISNNSSNLNPQKLQTIGYDRDGHEITIDNSLDTTLQKFRPPPVIESMTVTIKKDIYRAAEIHWKCFSLAQLEYMLPYFFTPYVTIVAEWGWNNFSSDSLINLNSNGRFVEAYDSGSYAVKTDNAGVLYDAKGVVIDNGVVSAFSCPEVFEQSVKKSSGNYDGMIGKIISWSYTFNDADYSFDCVTEIASDSKFQNSMMVNSLSNTSNASPNSDKKNTEILTEFFDKRFEEMVLNRINSTETEFNSDNLLRDLTYADRLCVFVPANYKVDTTSLFKDSDFMGDSKKKYVALKLFFDALNRFTAVKNLRNAASFYKILYDAEIGAHPNMISSDLDVLIPNTHAPFYYPESFIDDKMVVNTRKSEPHFNAGNVGSSDKDEDIQMRNVLRSSIRQDLNVIINYKSSTSDAAGFAFPYPNNPNLGKLKNIYVSTDFIKDVCKSATIGELIDKVCDKLNSVFPNIWKLERYNTANCIGIRDSNCLGAKDVIKDKSQFGLSASEPYLYFLEPFVQESISKNFKFGVELKDAIASQIMNKAQHDNGQTQVNTTSSMISSNLASGIVPSIENALLLSDSYNLFDPINVQLKRIDSEIEAKENAAKTPAEKKRDAATAQALQDGTYKKISDGTIVFRKQQGNVSKEALLTVPSDYRDKVLSLLSTPDGRANTSVNNSPMPGTSIEFTVLGIGGFKLFQIFAVSNLPEPYKDKVVFQVTEIKHQLQDNDWATVIVCVVRPVGSITKVFVG